MNKGKENNVSLPIEDDYESKNLIKSRHSRPASTNNSYHYQSIPDLLSLPMDKSIGNKITAPNVDESPINIEAEFTNKIDGHELLVAVIIMLIVSS